MADKKFIGKVSEKTFDNGGSIIRITLNDKDKQLLSESGNTTIAIKKSLKGTWYAEIDSWAAANPQTFAKPEPVDPGSDLPF